MIGICLLKPIRIFSLDNHLQFVLLNVSFAKLNVLIVTFIENIDMNISETRGKWFKIVKEDEELQVKFPELKKGTIIKVIGTTTEDGYGDHGIIEVMLNTGEKLCIYDRDTSLWCFWESHSIDELEEIDQVVCDGGLGEFEGERISYALAKLAGQENNDGYEGNLMQAAAEYIEYLERRLS
ncbi:protease inhibitor [Shigella phage ESh15]|nr:protease inhibitor [Shigella phage ESh15]